MAASEPSSTAPVPSKHVFLHELSKQTQGTKVRFLCCVIGYDVSKGHLLVEHAYPSNASPMPRAHVDVNVILDTTRPELLRDGSWINVMAYVQVVPACRVRRKVSVSRNDNEPNPRLPLVQAVLIWDAGSINTHDYEILLERQRRTWKNLKTVHSDG